MDKKIYIRYSKRLEDQMSRIAKVGRKVASNFARDAKLCPNQEFVQDAARAFQNVGGKPGDGALEIYRDIEINIATIKRFIDKWEHASGAGFDAILKLAWMLQEELTKLEEIIKEAGPDFMEEAENRIRSQQEPYMTKEGRYMTEEERYDFKGSNLVIVAVTGAVILARYLELITWSWYIVFPVGIGAAVLVSALISTIQFSQRRN